MSKVNRPIRLTQCCTQFKSSNPWCFVFAVERFSFDLKKMVLVSVCYLFYQPMFRLANRVAVLGQSEVSIDF